MRVISGTARGSILHSIENINTRPTLDRVKESLFNIIQNKIPDAVVLDLFAGSGALAIEALSRGAQKAYLCDYSKEAIQMINKNLEKTRLIEKTKIYNTDYMETLKRIEKENVKFDRFPLEERKMVYANLGKAFLMSIESDSYDSNKEYYILRYKFDKRNTWEVWLDKETGLVIREINRGGSIVYIPGTEIVKKESDIIEKYKYDFGIVNDEDVNVPDFSGYKVEYQNWNMSDIGK